MAYDLRRRSLPDDFRVVVIDQLESRPRLFVEGGVLLAAPRSLLCARERR
jgi:hypothetical protein